MDIYLWTTGGLALVLIAIGVAIALTSSARSFDGDYGQAVLGVVIAAGGAMIAMAHGIGWLVRWLM